LEFIVEFVTVSNPFLSSSDQDVAIDKHYRAQLMVSIRNMLYERGLNQKAAAELLGIKQPRVSDIINGKVSACSVEKLFLYLHKLGVELQFDYSEGAFHSCVTQQNVA
jgi:predicted XRE-type DNA-binding protein